MNDTRAEMERWTDAWRAEGDAAGGELATIRRRARRHVWAGVGNLLAGAVFLVVYTTWALLRPDPAMLVAAAAVWVIVLATTAFELWNRRDTWRPRNQSTRAFLDLTELQLHRRALGLRFGWVLLLVETAFFVPWIAWVVSDGSGRTEVVGSYLAAYGFLAAMVGGCAVVLVWLRRRVERQLTEVRELRAQLQAERRVA